MFESFNFYDFIKMNIEWGMCQLPNCPQEGDLSKIAFFLRLRLKIEVAESILHLELPSLVLINPT